MEIFYTNYALLAGAVSLSEEYSARLLSALRHAAVPDGMPFILLDDGTYETRLNAFLRALPSRQTAVGAWPTGRAHTVRSWPLDGRDELVGPPLERGSSGWHGPCGVELQGTRYAGSAHRRSYHLITHLMTHRMTIYIALPDTLLVVRRQDEAWHGERRLDGLPAQCVAADPLRPAIVCCGTFGRGLWRSVDAGATWRQVGADAFRSQQIMAVALSGVERAGAHNEHAVIYAGTEPSALYRSEDGGETWRELTTLLALPSAPTWSFPPRPATSHVRAIGLDPNTAGRLYVAIEAGALVRSVDGGRTWEDRRPSSPFDTHTLGLPSQRPGRIYSAAGDGVLQPGQGFVESRDAGDTWERPDAGLEHHYLWGLAVDPGDPDTLIVSAAHGPNQAHNPTAAASAMYRRAGGSAWQRVAEGLPAERGMLASELAANQAEPGVFYAATNLGLYRSVDAGLSWERVNLPWPEERDARRPASMTVVEEAERGGP